LLLQLKLESELLLLKGKRFLVVLYREGRLGVELFDGFLSLVSSVDHEVLARRLNRGRLPLKLLSALHGFLDLLIPECLAFSLQILDPLLEQAFLLTLNSVGLLLLLLGPLPNLVHVRLDLLLPSLLAQKAALGLVVDLYESLVGLLDVKKLVGLFLLQVRVVQDCEPLVLVLNCLQVLGLGELQLLETAIDLLLGLEGKLD
jgi:hypothetical protein